MRVLVINPNASDSMTAAIADAARAVAGPGVGIAARTNHAGPPSIQGAADGDRAVPGMLAEIGAAAGEGFGAIVIACFDDTGLAEARALAGCPVIGIGEAAFHAATLLGRRFSVVTTLAISVPVIERNIAGYGFAAACARVRASGVPVLEVDGAEARIRAEIVLALAEDDVDTIVLGCAGMAGFAARLTADLGVPVIDGVAAAVGFAQVVSGLAPRVRRSG